MFLQDGTTELSSSKDGVHQEKGKTMALKAVRRSARLPTISTMASDPEDKAGTFWVLGNGATSLVSVGQVPAAQGHRGRAVSRSYMLLRAKGTLLSQRTHRVSYPGGPRGQSIKPKAIIPKPQNLMEFALLSFLLAWHPCPSLLSNFSFE